MELVKAYRLLACLMNLSLVGQQLVRDVRCLGNAPGLLGFLDSHLRRSSEREGKGKIDSYKVLVVRFFERRA